MKSKFCTFAFILIFANVVNAQDYIPTAQDIARFTRTKTMMIMEDNLMSEYNLTMKEIVPDEWKITPYDFLDWRNFEPHNRDNNLSFLLLNRVQIERDRSNAQYLFMSLLLGGNARNLSSMPDLCSVPLAYYGDPEESYIYKIEIFLRFMQNHVRTLMSNPRIATQNVVAYYNNNVQRLNGKTLYLIAEYLDTDVNTEAKIRNIYPGPVKIVTREDIQRAINERDPSVVFLHKVGPGRRNVSNARSYKILVGAACAQFYYFDYHTVNSRNPDRFLASDFRSLARANR